MARITVEDCLEKVNNRFTLIHMAARRVRQLRKGDESTINSKNTDVVASLREIAAGNVLKAEPVVNNNIPENLLDSPPEEPKMIDEKQTPEIETNKGDENKGI